MQETIPSYQTHKAYTQYHINNSKSRIGPKHFCLQSVTITGTLWLLKGIDKLYYILQAG